MMAAPPPTHTHVYSNYRNPCCACAPRAMFGYNNIILVTSYQKAGYLNTQIAWNSTNCMEFHKPIIIVLVQGTKFQPEKTQPKSFCINHQQM